MRNRKQRDGERRIQIKTFEILQREKTVRTNLCTINEKRRENSKARERVVDKNKIEYGKRKKKKKRKENFTIPFTLELNPFLRFKGFFPGLFVVSRSISLSLRSPAFRPVVSSVPFRFLFHFSFLVFHLFFLPFILGLPSFFLPFFLGLPSFFSFFFLGLPSFFFSFFNEKYKELHFVFILGVCGGGSLVFDYFFFFGRKRFGSRLIVGNCFLYGYELVVFYLFIFYFFFISTRVIRHKKLS